MKFFFAVLLPLCIITSPALAHDLPTGPQSTSAKPKKHLRHFSSKEELRFYITKLKKLLRGYGHGDGYGDGSGVSYSMSAATVDVVSTGGGGGGGREEQITNTQHEGVDEGSIVKLHGNYLVVLRRGRLFTVDVSGKDLHAASMINAYGPDVDPEGTWYDEMLISGENVVVVGYSYERDGTEIGLFKIDEQGRLTYDSTYHLRSNDYYSSRNYSSRLIGDKLIFYSPLDVDLESKNPFNAFPGLRRWHKGAKASEFRSIELADRVYVADGYKPDPFDVTLHTVTTCTIGNELTCTAESVIGPSGDVFYVSPKNVYVWAATSYPENSRERNRSQLFKMPLDGSDPSAIRVSGSPVDQFSFRETENEEMNIVVRADSKGDGMWNAKVAEGDTAFLRLHSEDFNNGLGVAPRTSYQKLESPEGYDFQNRFVGDYLLYGTMTYSSEQKELDANKVLFALDCSTGVLTKIKLDHDVRRLDLLGKDGIVVGNSNQDLTFSSIKLDGSPRVMDTYTVQHASQGETRSQGFFYKPIDESGGLLGLPVIRASSVSRRMGDADAATITFLRNTDLRFENIGELTGKMPGSTNDDCKASCVDWYGDARPIFAKGRIFALLGYEIVEGNLLSGGSMQEIGRLDFSPSAVAGKR